MKPTTIIIADSLTNDFLSPRPEFLQVRVNVGLAEIHRLLGKEEQFGSGPLPEFLRAANQAREKGLPIHLIFIRDLHDLSDPRQLPEVLRYDPHNIKGSQGAEFLPCIAPIAVKNRVIDTSTLSIPVQGFHAIMQDLFGKSILELSAEERELVTFIITGVYSEVRILATAFKLRNDYQFPNVIVCPHLIGSKDAQGHDHAIKAGFPDALVWVEADLGSIAHQTGIDIPSHILKEFHPCEVGPESLTGKFPEEWRLIVSQSYCFYDRVHLKTLTGGFSGCGLFLAQGEKEKARTEFSVLKIGSHQQILRELHGYHQVKDFLGSAIPRLETPVSSGTSTAVRMELASKKGSPTTLQHFFEAVQSLLSLKKFLKIQKSVLDILSQKLYQNTVSQKPLYPYREHGLAQSRQIRFLTENIGHILPGWNADATTLPLHPQVTLPSFHNDFRHLIAFVDRLAGRVALCHGDLNFANQLLDPHGNVWLIDWAYAGERPLETDFAKMENDLKFVLSKDVQEKDLPLLAAFEEYLLSHPALPLAAKAPPDLAALLVDLRFLKIYEAVRQVRRAYLAIAGKIPAVLYQIALLRYASHTLSFDARRNRGECSPAQLKYALLSAARLTRLIAQDESHLRGQSDRPENYPARFPVPPQMKAWATPFPEYQPRYFVQADVLEHDREVSPGGWAEPENPAKVEHLNQRRSGLGPLAFSADGKPLNPHGRTGLAGRGFFGQWGPNIAVDPIVVRIGPASGRLEFLLIKRPNARQWGLPGVILREQERPEDGANRSLGEKCGLKIPAQQFWFYPQMFVEDFRNTDHAWMETLPCLYFYGTAVTPGLNPPEEEVVKDVAWRELSPELAGNLFASHIQVITTVLTAQLREGKPCLPPILVRELLEILPEFSPGQESPGQESPGPADPAP